MGYYTKYSITVNNRGNTEYDMNVGHFDGDDEEFIADYLMDYNPFEDSCKWYDHDADMRRLSSKFHNVLFTLEGEGEENGDLWISYYLNGKSQFCKAQITFESFDESKLA